MHKRWPLRWKATLYGLVMAVIPLLVIGGAALAKIADFGNEATNQATATLTNQTRNKPQPYPMKSAAFPIHCSIQ